MTDNEIKKALVCCADEMGCAKGCPFFDKKKSKCKVASPYGAFEKLLLDLLNRQQAKIEALQMDNEQLQSDVINANMNLEHMTAEFEELEAEYEKVYEQAEADILGNLPQGGASCHWCIDKHKKYAIKEFAERLKYKYSIFCRYCGGFIKLEINNLVKEMVGEE